MNKVLEISRADYNTILLHAEKISTGQQDFAPILCRELREKLNIADAESLLKDLVQNKDIEFLNRVRLFLSQFSFVVVGDNGARYQLVKRGNFCELDVVEQSTEPFVDDTPARESEDDDSATKPIELPVEETPVQVVTVTLEVRAERIRQLQADVQRGIIEIGFELIAAKSQVGHGGWADWLQNEFDWTQQTANRFMRVAERFGKLNNVVQFKPSTLQAMLALPTGDEEAFIEAQVQAGNPVENQSARQVQESVKQWKEAKSKEVSETVSNEFNLFADEYEVADQNQRVGENESTPIPNSELNLPPTEDSDESVDEDASAESSQSFTVEENLSVELEKKRAETQKLLDEISMLIQTAADTKIEETIRELKSICKVLKEEKY